MSSEFMKLDNKEKPKILYSGAVNKLTLLHSLAIFWLLTVMIIGKSKYGVLSR
jgi:hypothetical protein